MILLDRLLVVLFGGFISYALWRDKKIHEETLAKLNYVYSKEVHAENHLYVQKIKHIEKANELLGEIVYWADKSVHATTHYKGKDPTTKMVAAFEEFSLHVFRFAYSFTDKTVLREKLVELSNQINVITNKTNEEGFSSQSQPWEEAVRKFHEELSPLANSLQKNLVECMSNK